MAPKWGRGKTSMPHDDGFHGSDTKLGVDTEAQTADYGATATPSGGVSSRGTHGLLTRRQTISDGELQFPSKLRTWTIQDSESTMDDVSIVINLLADMSPAGVLPLAFGMSGTGIVPALIMLVVFTAAAAYMMYLIARTMEITRKNTYSEIWEHVVGEGTTWIPTLVVFSVCFGCCLAYACMFGDLFAGCLPAFGIGYASRTVCLIALAAFPLSWLCMLKDLSALAPSSFGALAAVFYMLVMMATRYFDGSYAPGGPFYDKDKVGDISGKTFNVDASTFLLVNCLAVAYLVHYNGCKYYREYVNHRPKQFGSRLLLAFTIVACFFAAAMLLGYYTFGNLSNSVILNNYAANDMLANVARLGMGLANVLSFPLMFSGLREQSLALIAIIMPDMQETTELVAFQNNLSRTMLTCIIVVAVLVKDASLVIGLVGSVCGSATIYVLPAFLFDRSCHHQFSGLIGTAERILVRIICATGVFLMFAGAAATLFL